MKVESQAEPIPGYKLIERLGGGGFGEVWKVEAPGGLHKAIKFVFGDIETAGDEAMRAEQELKALHRVKMVRHPYILSLEQFVIVEGRLLIVMELADRNLWDRFRECREQGLQGIPREELLNYMEEIAEALDMMNNQYQLQHLDIKPQNLFLMHNHVKVADFGLVKDLEGVAAKVTGGVTPVYAAPETFDGWVSRFCDQYSLAIVYQELLTGQRPFAGTNIHQLVMQHVQGKPNLTPLPPQDQPAIARALAKNPDQRFPSCTDMVLALRAAAAVPAKPPSGLIPEVVREAAESGRKSGAEIVMTPPPSPRAPVEATTNFIGAQAESLRRKAEAQARPAAPPEVTGDGELYPAMVIGLGQIGFWVLQELSSGLQGRFGSMDALPHVRLVYLDTDPDALQAVAPGSRGPGTLPGGEVLLARLSRASHYLKPRDGRPRIDNWFSQNMLYRIQRNQVTGGLRALGRLAFIDNYRAIAQRLRADLDACLQPQALKVACERSGLKLRTNRPRVYIVTSLAGGTGGGMFIDLAYVVREYLRQHGLDRPDVVGLLLLPPLDKNPARKMALGNAYAALTELNHFSTRGSIFSARFDEREETLADSDPPFNRCVLLNLPEGTEEKPAREVTGLAGEWIARELTTPLGRKMDECRAALPSSLRPADALACQSFGLFRFAWPRPALLQKAGRRFCRQLLERWITKDSKPIQKMVEAYVQEQWAKKELGGEFLIARLQAVCERALGKSPESAFNAVNEPFMAKKGWFGGGPEVKPETVRQVMNKIEELVGAPTQSTVLSKPGLLDETLRKEAETIFADWEKKLGGIPNLVEQPEFRLAGAEEAIRQFVNLIEKVLQHHEPLGQEFTEKTGKGYERLQTLVPGIEQILEGGRKTGPFLTELIELLRAYPKWRHQSLILKRLSLTYTSLRGRLSDQLREINFCRVRLGELLQAFEDQEGEELAGGDRNTRFLFPAGCRTADDVVNHFFGNISDKDLEELDKRMQGMIRQQFRGIMHVCTTSANLLKNLEIAMLDEAMAFAGGKLAGDDVVDMFLGRYPRPEEAVDTLANAFDEAMPGLSGPRAKETEICFLAVPPSSQEARFRELARQAVPDRELVPAASLDDLVFYREETQLPLSSLEQLGQEGREAYQQMVATENFTPHSRMDITEWQEPASAN